MNRILKSTVVPSLMAASLIGTTLFSVKPASAGDNTLRDAGIGAVTNVLTGAVTGHSSVLGNAVDGAAAGASVSAVRRASGGHRNLARDVATGAAASTVTGAVTGQHNHLGHAIGGAATGAVLDLLTR